MQDHTAELQRVDDGLFEVEQLDDDSPRRCGVHSHLWVVSRVVPTAQHLDVRVGYELFITEEAAREWAGSEPMDPAERRMIQRKAIR